jgi:sulfur-carrier protein
MAVRVRIPSPLRSVTDGAAEVSVESESVAGALSELETRYPAIRGRLRDEEGALRRFVNLYVNGEDVRYLGALETPVNEGDTVSILPAVAGGSGDHALHSNTIAGGEGGGWSGGQFLMSMPCTSRR